MDATSPITHIAVPQQIVIISKFFCIRLMLFVTLHSLSVESFICNLLANKL